MYRILILLALSLPVVVPTSSASACHACKKRCVTCPKCNSCCEFKAEATKETKHCYKIECEEICVPRIVFPWQNRHLKGGKTTQSSCGCSGCSNRSCSGCSSCGGSCSYCKSVRHNGARVITVRRFKKHEYECPTCKYSWSVKQPSNCSGSSWCAGSSVPPADNGDAPDPMPEAFQKEGGVPTLDAPTPPARDAELDPKAATRQSLSSLLHGPSMSRQHTTAKRPQVKTKPTTSAKTLVSFADELPAPGLLQLARHAER